jgi:CheY-like chemotaxis protein
MPLSQNNYFYYSDVAFGQLMNKRVNKILLICSTYDAFMLEEDGRIDEQIFNEYVALNLRYPPQFLLVTEADEALEILDNDSIDMVISTLSLVGMDAFELAKIIKKKDLGIPFVLLTPFSRETRLMLKNEDTSGIDAVFSWLGHSDIMLAIVKLLEDSNNADHDVNVVGVQVIILVEDSIRFYSSYLPNIYKIIFNQSKKFMAEGLNEHQKTMRMRGRPKILLATNYEKAVEYYEKYKNNLLGIISDISYPRNGEQDKHAGLRLCKRVRKEDRFLPFLLQSSDSENIVHAKRLRAGFIDKNSKTLIHELKDYIVENFAFGDFVFICPRTNKEVGRASDLQSLQRLVKEIPDEVLSYHVNRNHFSKWFKARALFHIANMFKYMRAEHFSNLDEVRDFIFQTLSGYRKNTARGVIAKYYRKKFDGYVMFARIGEGSIGGKARGLAFIDMLLKKNKLHHKYKGVSISIPKTVVISTDIFDYFMDGNDLYKIALSDLEDEEILNHFVKAKLPKSLIRDLKYYIRVIDKPIAVRSSSLLEDSHYQPFAGIYSTFMLPMIGEEELRLRRLAEAIKSVYASVYFKGSKSYMQVTKNVIDEEKMAIVLQEVCGNVHDDLFMPSFSGVTRSVNFYPVIDEKAEDGVVELALGLGKHIVDGGGHNLRFSPKSPQKVLQLSTPELALASTQKHFFALKMDTDSFKPSINDDINLVKLSIRKVPEDRSFRMLLSTYDFHSDMIRDGWIDGGKKIVSFSHVLKYNKFPLAEIIAEVLEMGQAAMNNPVEIEFAVNLKKDSSGEMMFNLLQIRPIVETSKSQTVDIEEKDADQALIVSNSALGNGVIMGMRDIVYMKTANFDASNNPKLPAIIEKINAGFAERKENYILIGPGRWGSHDSWLGIPVIWPQISEARLIVESGLENYRIDPSQGTHFFQNLTSFHVGYFTINPFINDGSYNVDVLDSMEAIYEDEYIRHVRFDEELVVKIDGRKSRGVILKNLAEQDQDNI